MQEEEEVVMEIQKQKMRIAAKTCDHQIKGYFKPSGMYELSILSEEDSAMESNLNMVNHINVIRHNVIGKTD